MTLLMCIWIFIISFTTWKIINDLITMVSFGKVCPNCIIELLSIVFRILTSMSKIINYLYIVDISSLIKHIHLIIHMLILRCFKNCFAKLINICVILFLFITNAHKLKWHYNLRILNYILSCLFNEIRYIYNTLTECCFHNA